MGEIMEIIRQFLPPGSPIFSYGEIPDDSWAQARGMHDFQQGVAKIHYILSRTKNPQEAKALFEANLRGEAEGPIQSETEILREMRGENKETRGRGRMK